MLSLTLGLLGLPALAQLTPAEAVAAMGRGINMGNTLEPPREGAWNNPPAEERYFDLYRDAGFTNVRVPVRWDEHTARTAPFAIDAAWMDRVEEVVDWGLARGLYITINGHHEDWLKEDYANPVLRARYDAIWTQIVARFQGKSDRLLYEVINEPFGMTRAEVDDLNERTLAIIRAAEPTRLVVYGGHNYSNSDELIAAAVPGGGTDDYLIGYFHSYDPWDLAGLGMGTWGTPADYSALRRKFEEVSQWSRDTGIPVHLSEFGVVRVADYNSRMRHYAAFVEECVERGWAFSVWDDGGTYGVLDRRDYAWPAVKDLLLHTYADSPDRLETRATATPTDTTAVQLSWRNRAAGTADLVIERQVNKGPFEALVTVAPTTSVYVDVSADALNDFTYRIRTTRTADGTELQSYPSRIRLAPRVGVVDYGDELDGADRRFVGNPQGVTFGVDDGVLTFSGDGTSPQYSVFKYELRDANGNDEIANAVASNDRLYLRARCVSGGSANVRIDLVDEDNFHTTNAGADNTISGEEWRVYTFDYGGGRYVDGAYGGTSCLTGPCPVDGERIAAMTFYPDGPTGGFDETIEVDWISFGQPLVSSATEVLGATVLQASPNPSSGRLGLDFGLEQASTVGARVLDATGHTVVRLPPIPYTAGPQRLELDLRHLPAGVYAVQLRVGEGYAPGVTVVLE